MTWTVMLTRAWRQWVMTLALVGAGMALTMFAAWQVWIIADQRWPASVTTERMHAVTVALFVTLGLIGLVLLSFGMVVVVRSFKASGSTAGFSIEAEAHDADGYQASSTTVVEGEKA